MTIDVNERFPFNEMEDVYVTDKYGYRHPMKKIPKFYYRRCKAEGGPSKGNDAWLISKVKHPGFHCPPAFMYHGKEVPFICIGRGIFKKNNDTDKHPQTCLNDWNGAWKCDSSDLNLVTVCSKLIPKYHSRLWTIYDLFVIQILFMIDTCTTDYQAYYDEYGEWRKWNDSKNHGNWFITKSSWRNIFMLSRGVCYVDGAVSYDQGNSFYLSMPVCFNNSNLHVYDNQGNFTWVDTGVKASKSFYSPYFPLFKTPLDIQVNGFDSADVFFPGTITENTYHTVNTPFGCDEAFMFLNGTGCTIINEDGDIVLSNRRNGLFNIEIGSVRPCDNGASGRLVTLGHD